MRRLIAVGLALLFGAAATSVGSAQTTAAAASAASRFDGRYSGTSTLERGWGVCGPEHGTPKIVVQGGQFQYTYNRDWHVVVTATVSPDGSVDGRQEFRGGSNKSRNEVRLTGKVTGDTMNVMVEGNSCARRLVLQKQK